MSPPKQTSTWRGETYNQSKKKTKRNRSDLILDFDTSQLNTKINGQRTVPWEYFTAEIRKHAADLLRSRTSLRQNISA